MAKRLVKHGDHLAVIIEPEILEHVGITKDTNLQIGIEGKNIVIVPLKRRGQERAETYAEDRLRLKQAKKERKA